MSKRVNLRDNFLYFIIWGLVRFIFFTLRRIKIKGTENIPEESVIISPNHRSYLDPLIVGAACNIFLSYMAKKELFSIPVLGYILPKINAFPVDRESSDVSAIKTALRILQADSSVVIFPEGGRRRGKSIDDSFKHGIGYISCKTQKAVIPVYLKNTDAFFSLKPIEVIFGKAIYPPVNYIKSDYELLTGKIRDEMKNLATQSER